MVAIAKSRVGSCIPIVLGNATVSQVNKTVARDDFCILSITFLIDYNYLGTELLGNIPHIKNTTNGLRYRFGFATGHSLNKM